MIGSFASVFALSVVVAFASPSAASGPDQAVCAGWGHCPPYTYTLASFSAARSYGVLVAVPDDMTCDLVRFRIRRPGGRTLGMTPPLLAGDVAVLRMGSGFASGNHDLLIEASGCALHPSEARRVLLGRQSADHGWRIRPAAALRE